MTTVSHKKYNPATKRFKAGKPLFRATYARPHGRPRNVRRVLKVRVFDL